MFSHNDNCLQSESALEGYVSCVINFYRDEDLQRLKLFLRSDKQTCQLVKDLNEQADAAQLQAMEVRRTKADEALRVKHSEPGSSSRAAPASRKIDPLALDLAVERESLSARRDSDSVCNELTHVPVYDWDEPLKLIEGKNATPDSEIHKRNVDVFKKLKAKGHLRKIVNQFDQENLLSRLEQLRGAQPHFAEVVDLVVQQIALSSAREQPLKLPPILLNGDPGVGKTFFTHALALALGAPMRRHSFDSAVTESGLTGSDRNWGNTTYGLVFETLCLGDVANPIVLLDEIDKASQSHYRNPIAPLHTLLEPITSNRTLDISIGITFNASFVSWIATANNPSRVPASIRSRFIEFDIQLPTGEHALRVARGVADSVYEEMLLPDFEPISPQIVKLIAHLVPREQGQVLRRAFACAISNQRKSLQRQDFPLDVLLSEDESTADPNEDQPKYIH